MITFILGRSGTGKTHAVMDEIRRLLKAEPDGPPLFLLLPDQATFQAEQALLKEPGLPGMTRCEVLSFRRLAYRVYERMGIPVEAPLSELGRLLLLRRSYENASDAFSVFPRQVGSSEIAQVGAGLFQFIRHAHTPESLRALSETVSDHALSAKLTDFRILFESYLEQLERTGEDPDLLLTRMLAVLRRSEYLEGARIWIDGFADFSGQERRILEVLAQRSTFMKIALLLDPARISPAKAQEKTGAALFAPVLKTYHLLLEDFREAGIEVMQPICLDGTPRRFSHSAPFTFLERHLFSSDDAVYEGAVSEIEVAVCAHPGKEVDCAVRTILDLVAEKGFRYRDIALIVRDLDSWHERAGAALSEHDIPFFIDRRRSLQHHLFVVFLRTIGECLVDGFSTDSLRRLLKTGFTPVRGSESDVLENLMLRTGLAGDALWNDDQDSAGIRDLFMRPDAGEEANDAEALKKKFAGSLKPLKEKRNETCSVKTWASFLYFFVKETGGFSLLYQRAQEAEDDGALSTAQEHRLVAEHFAGLLDDIVAAAGAQPVTAAEFFKILDLGLSSWTVGLTPPGLDQVLVGGIQRSRHPELKAVLLLGFNEGTFPRSMQEDALLSDADKQQLTEAGVTQFTGTWEEILAERLLAYIALTRASGHLYISYSEKNAQGREVFPSTFLSELIMRFPKLSVTRKGSPLFLATTPERVAEGYLQSRKSSTGSTSWNELYRWTRAHHLLSGPLQESMAAAGRVQAEETVPLNGGKAFQTGVTSLEIFARCPFRYFARYRLSLKEREEFMLGGLERGLLRHKLLELAGRRLIREKKQLADLSDDDVASYVHEALTCSLTVRGEDKPLELDPLMNYVSEGMKEEITAFLIMRRRLESQGNWRPYEVELPFGGGGKLPPLVFTSGSCPVSVKGVIDRLDAAEDARGRRCLMLYDFKGGTVFNINDVFHGLSLQLPVYLLAVRQGQEDGSGRKAVLCGALFHSTRTTLVSASAPAPQESSSSAEQLRSKPRGLLTVKGLSLFEPHLLEKGGRSSLFTASIKKSGEIGNRNSSDLYTEEELNALLAHVRKQVEKHIEKLTSGSIAAEPALVRNRSACAYCPFNALCRFDQVLDRKRYRVFESLGGTEILNRLRNSGGEGRGGATQGKRS